MIKEIEALPPEQQRVMYDAVPYVILLVAGADGIIENEELERGEKIAHIRSFRYHKEWLDYYQKIDIQLHSRLLELIGLLPRDTESRQQALSRELSKLNDILPHMEARHAKHFYDGLRSFARHVATASGGIIGWVSIGPREAQVVDLPMIDPIE